jgi:hypothetical protein
MDLAAGHVNSPYLATTYNPQTQFNTRTRLFEHHTRRDECRQPSKLTVPRAGWSSAQFDGTRVSREEPGALIVFWIGNAKLRKNDAAGPTARQPPEHDSMRPRRLSTGVLDAASHAPAVHRPQTAVQCDPRAPWRARIVAPVGRKRVDDLLRIVWLQVVRARYRAPRARVTSNGTRRRLRHRPDRRMLRRRESSLSPTMSASFDTFTD